MRISDWSSDVCSSDLLGQNGVVNLREHRLADGRGVHGRAPAGPEKGAHRRMALELSDVDQLVLVLHGESHRLSDILHQPAHDRPSEGDDAAVAQAAGDDIERAHATHTDPVLLSASGETAHAERQSVALGKSWAVQVEHGGVGTSKK